MTYVVCRLSSSNGVVSIDVCCLVCECLLSHSIVRVVLFMYIVQELMSHLSANLFATEFERHELALRQSIESAEAVLVQHVARLRHGMDVSDLILEHKVLSQVFYRILAGYNKCVYSMSAFTNRRITAKYLYYYTASGVSILVLGIYELL